MSQEKSKTKTNKKIFFLVMILVALLAALISMEYGKTVTNGKFSSNIKPIKEFSYDAGSKADFAVWEDNIYYCTKDGIQYINSKGDVIWSETYNMALPYFVQNKAIIGISEQKGRTMIVYNAEGKKYSVQTNNPIVSFSVNSEGFSSIITSSDTEYQLEVYNSEGVIIFSGHFQIAQGIPVSSSISNNGKILAIGFLNISEMTVSSRVSFYVIDAKNTKSGETNTPVFASLTEAESACGIVNFFDDNTVAVISDKSLTFVYVNPDETEKYKEKAKITFKNQIKQVSFDQNGNVYAAFGEKLINSGTDALESGTVICYTKDGNQKFTVPTGKKVTGIYPSKNSFLIGMDRLFQNYDFSGKFIWEYNTNQDTKKMLLLNSDNLVLFVGTNKASLIKLSDDVLQNEQADIPQEQETSEENVEEKPKTEVKQTTEKTVEETTIETSSASNNEKQTDKSDKNNKQNSTAVNNKTNSEKQNNTEKQKEKTEKPTAETTEVKTEAKPEAKPEPTTAPPNNSTNTQNTPQKPSDTVEKETSAPVQNPPHQESDLVLPET